VAYQRGFKKHANDLAAEVRAELGLGAFDRLDPKRLAEHLAIPVIPLSELRQDAPEAVPYFLDQDEGSFSAVTVFRGHRRAIVYNDAHLPGRQNSDIAHEIAHALLMHEPGPAFGKGGCRNWNPDQEDEANFLGAALLVTEPAALQIVRRGVDLRDAAAAYAVSPKLMRWRINVTGAQKRVQRSRNYARQS
jgi:Zn-dependent peptidase ImmA (M78 family)